MRYFTLGKYVFEAYGKKYVLELAKNNELLKEKTPILFYEAKQWVEQHNMQYNQALNPLEEKHSR